MSVTLDSFTVYPQPPPPLHRGTNLTLRSQYYEVFLMNGAFTASGLLLCALEYALGVTRMTSLRLGAKSTQLLVFLSASIPFQLCILDFPCADYRTFLLPYLAIATAVALLALAHQRWHLRDCPRAANHVATADATYLTSENRNFNPLLAAFRSGLYTCTSLCVFCRDLPCWNNRLSKSKAFGTGLMDLGIGCFVVCLGTVGPTAVRPAHLVKRAPALRRSARQSALLGCLGLCVGLHRAWQFRAGQRADPRRFSAEWREYGVHWSAFWSLAVARLLGTGLELLALPVRAPPLLAAGAVAAAHEVALSWGLAELVLAPGRAEPYNRSNLIGQNREGLASVPGLVTLYLAGVQLGRWARDWSSGIAMVRILGLLALALAWRPLVVASGGAILPESRRLLSPSYCAWVLAFTCFCLLSGGLLQALRLRLSTGGPPRLLQMRHLAGFDRAGLVAFLVANLTTGAFNAAVDAAGVNREADIGGSGRLCFAMALAYSVVTQVASLRLCEVTAVAASATPAGLRLVDV